VRARLWRALFALAGLASGTWVAHVVLPSQGVWRAYARDVRQRAGPNLQIFYLVPADGPDRRLDLDGTIARSVNAATTWFETESGGLRLRVEAEFGRQVLFHRSLRSRSGWLSLGKYAAYEIEREFGEVGWDSSKSVLGVYFDGPNGQTCGDSISPDHVNAGRLAILYLSSPWPTDRPCRSVPLAVDGGRPGYWEFLLLHEIVHALGFVPSCARHVAALGHVSDSPADLMYRGPLAWAPEKLDYKRDDYFRHRKAGCPDLADSPFLALRQAAD